MFAVMMRDFAGMRGEIKGAPHTPLSSPDLIGRSSIPEAAVIEPIRRGVLDAPVKPGHDTGN
ncbi:hypothetical protein [Bradyrhizobium sp. CCGUVB14]|uniref:hypothetical protein n=1 Tax=Bradyrhizobium sp. CCGUVB14 TaxID=2949628 RepID=UPI0020B3D9FE|nr:hypothetical protein [Bradyrhizobium sp. CCGUVB14]MCP3439663.1 hypothetical protein [Bradyrhizobium sp. CCGUVB14]